MGSINHHQERSAAFLGRARTAGQAGDIADAAVALRRSVSHAATALAVNAGLCHNTRHRLEIAIHGCVSSGRMSRSHVKTFRQVHSLPEYLASAETRHGKRVGDRGCPLRRLRRRVAALLKDAEAIIAGNPRPVRYHKRWARGLPPRFRPRGPPAHHQRARHPRPAQLRRDRRRMEARKGAPDAECGPPRLVRARRRSNPLPLPPGNRRNIDTPRHPFSLVPHLAKGLGTRSGHPNPGRPPGITQAAPACSLMSLRAQRGNLVAVARAEGHSSRAMYNGGHHFSKSPTLA